MGRSGRGCRIAESGMLIVPWLQRKPPRNLEEFRQALDFYDELNPIDPTLEVDPEDIGLEQDDDL